MVIGAGTITFSSPASGSKVSGAYTISGTTPNPSATVLIQVKNPGGSVVDSKNVLADGSGAFTFSTSTGTGASWPTGTYTIAATDSLGATGSTTYSFTSITITPFNQTQWILDIARNQTIINQKLNTLSKDLKGNMTALNTQETSEATTLAGIVSSLNTLTGDVTTLSSSVSAIQNSLTSLSQTVGTINTNVSNLGTSVTNAVTQATNAANNASSVQTYVLVVAVLAAITLVLELAILVRKLS
jgi:hypothetical protein